MYLYHHAFLFNILTDFAYRLNGKKNVIYHTIIDRFFLARGKSAQADIICNCKMTSAMALDGVTSKDVRNISKVCDKVQILDRIIQCNGGKFGEDEASNVFSWFIVC